MPWPTVADEKRNVRTRTPSVKASRPATRSSRSSCRVRPATNTAAGARAATEITPSVFNRTPGTSSTTANPRAATMP